MGTVSRRHSATALVLAALLMGGSTSAVAQGDVHSLVLSKAVAVVELDLAKLEGEPSRLCWSPDQRRLYLRTTHVDLWGNERNWHHVVDVGSRSLRTEDNEPAWAAAYWAAKSALAAPGVAGFSVVLESRQERAMATGVQGSLAPAMDPSRGAELGPQGAAIVSSAMQAQLVTRSTLKLKGELIGEFVNTPPRLGLTFGWASPGTGLIAYVVPKHRLELMDQDGRRRRVGEVEEAVLPAWGPDGGRLAFLEKTGKKRYVLQIIEVSAREP